MSKIETRLSEQRYITTDPKRMIGKFTAKRVLRGWTEDFIDDDTGEIASIERNEVLVEKGVLIDQDVASELQFFTQAGELAEVEVSNQRRIAQHVKRDYLALHMANVQIGGKARKFLVYATSIEFASEVLTDYIELNFTDPFCIRGIKDYPVGIVIVDSFKKSGDDSSRDQEEDTEERKFFQIDFSVEVAGMHESINTAIVQTYSIDRAMMLINDHLIKQEQKREVRWRRDGLKYTAREITISLDAAKPISLTAYVPKEFSEAYIPISEQDLMSLVDNYIEEVKMI